MYNKVSNAKDDMPPNIRLKILYTMTSFSQSCKSATGDTFSLILSLFTKINVYSQVHKNGGPLVL